MWQSKVAKVGWGVYKRTRKRVVRKQRRHWSLTWPGVGFANNQFMDCIFQQGNAAIHEAKATIDFSKSINILVLTWPAKNIDLNSIKNWWSVLLTQVFKNRRQSDFWGFERTKSAKLLKNYYLIQCYLD